MIWYREKIYFPQIFFFSLIPPLISFPISNPFTQLYAGLCSRALTRDKEPVRFFVQIFGLFDSTLREENDGAWLYPYTDGVPSIWLRITFGPPWWWWWWWSTTFKRRSTSGSIASHVDNNFSIRLLFTQCNMRLKGFSHWESYQDITWGISR